MTQWLNKFWSQYEKRYRLYAGLTAGLFLLQLVHLFWLTTHAVWHRLFGYSLFNPGEIYELIIIFVDYTEIPALLATSLLYVNELRKQWYWKNFWYLLLINSQWLHLFWITDEFVIEQFMGHSTVILPVWLAWVAILIDYLELPVIYDTIKKFLRFSKSKA
jgi:hypothetical protein